MADIVFTDANFKAEVLEEKSLPVLIDFWAPWCGPCKIMSPIVEQLAEEYAGKVKIGKLNVDDNPHTAAEYGVMSIPTLVFFKSGKVVKTVVGAQPKEALKKAIDEMLSAA